MADNALSYAARQHGAAALFRRSRTCGRRRVSGGIFSGTAGAAACLEQGGFFRGYLCEEAQQRRQKLAHSRTSASLEMNDRNGAKRASLKGRLRSERLSQFGQNRSPRLTTKISS